MRVGCGALFVVYAIIVVLRSHETGTAFLGFRVAMLLYAALGVWLATRVTWQVQRRYIACLALILPLQASYISAALGNQLGDVAFTALAIFTPLLFVQTARDLIVVDLCLVAGNALILASAPTPAIPVATLAVTLGAVLVTASVVAMRTLVYRARLAESVARLEGALADRAAWQSRYEAATAASGQVLYDWEPATDRIRWGGACEQILGYAEGELDGGLGQWNAMIHPDDVARFDEEIASVLARRRPFRLRYRVRRKDGEWIVVDDTGHFVFGEDGDIVRMVGFVADVTERSGVELARDEEAAISAALARVGRELISSLETPVVMDRLCHVTAEVLGCDFSQTWIRQAEESAYVVLSGHGLTADEWEHLRLLRLPVDPSNGLLARIAQEGAAEVLPSTTSYPLAASLLCHYGFGATLFIALRRGEEMVGVHLVGYRGATGSFSERQRRIALGIGQLGSMGLTNAQLVEELERASNLKSEFVSTMSHELRTPLNVILGYADMLADEALSASQELLVSRVRCSSIELLEMIEATLDLSRIAAGKDVPTFERISLAALWAELATEFEALPRKDPIELRWEPPGDVWMCTDRRKLKMVLKNLVANAMKFTAEGEVVASCAMSEDEQGLVFTVRDTGIGIPAEHLASIFDMFRQVDSSDARSYSGVGLGLYIVRQLATQLGGSVEVESEHGRGSTFRVRLPLAPRGDRRIAA
jgi:PAS domain S-box-containing protein